MRSVGRVTRQTCPKVTPPLCYANNEMVKYGVMLPSWVVE
jgi:hypothetical protein